MKPERREQIHNLLQSALARVPQERSAFLAQACADDELLRSEVESLIAAHEDASNFLEPPVSEIAADLPVKGQARRPIEAGTVIGRYEVAGLLGAGGMGEVYRARDTHLRRSVALKLLSRDFAQNEDRLRRFRQEAFAASALNHPNIITIYEIGENEFGPFIATEFVEGETLRQRLKRAPVENREALDLAAQVASALAAAHSAGVTHRDIKPDNIMIRRDGYVKVLDFGLAKLGEKAIEDPKVDLDAATAPLAVTSAGMIIGTLKYMSPEQARGLKVDARTDIWSLGVVIYEMLSGRVPFEGPTASDLIVAILDREPPPLALCNPAVPTELQKIVHKTLRKEKGDRYQTVEELRMDLGKVKQLLELEAAVETSSRNFAAPRLAGARHTVGRHTELAELHSGFESAATGPSLLLCVAGEPGIGKTTLVEEFLAQVAASAQPCYIARGRSSERLAGTETYFPFLEALESLFHREGNEELARAMKLLAPTWYLQIAHPSEDSVNSQIVDAAQTSSQDRMKRELGAFLQEVSRTRPLILFFDDLQWADVSTIDLLAYLAGKFDAMRLLIVVAYRQSEMLLANHPFLSVKLNLQARSVCREMPLEFLTREEVDGYLALEFPEHEFPAEFAALVYAKTEGSPLFMVDLARYLRDRKVIKRDQQRWVLSQSMPDVERELPESVRSMIQRKIDQLSEDDRRLLVAASVEGYEFNSVVVARTLPVEVEEVEARLQALDSMHGLVRLTDEQELPDESLTQRYQFVHVLYQNALYASLTPRRRASLSAAVAQALLEHYGDQSPTVASKLAFLFESARDWSRAAEYFLLAAENAARLFANEETITLARRGLEMLKRLPDTTERARQELRLQIVLGSPLMATKGYAASETMQAYSRARELCQQSGESDKNFQVLFGLCVICVVRSEHERALEIAEQMLPLGESSRDPVELLQAHWTLGLILHYLGELSRALDHLERTIGFYDQKHYRSQLFLYGADAGVLTRAYTARVLWILGYPDRAREMVHAASALAEKVRHPMSLAVTMSAAVTLDACCGDERMAQKSAEGLISFSAEQGLPFYSSVGTIWSGWALAMQGQDREGLAQLRDGMARYRAIGSELARTSYLALLGEALGEAGQPGEGLNVLAEALTAANLTGERFYEAELHRLKGELLLMQATGEEARLSVEALRTRSAERPAISAAETCFLRAIDIARQQDAKSWELRAVMSLHRLRRKQGKQKESQQLLREIFEWFTEGFDTADLREARALLADSSAATF
jgi:predicted ATPase